MTTDVIVGERVHQVMWRNRVSQVQLADKLGMVQSTLSRKLRGQRPWTLDELLSAAAYLEVPVTDLLPLAGPDEPGGSRPTVPEVAFPVTRLAA